MSYPFNYKAIDFKEQIMLLANIREVVEHYGFTVKNSFISCPFHSERTASCKIYEETNSFYCFGCGAGGDVINFVSRLENIDFKEAMKRINDTFDLGINLKPSLRNSRAFEKQLIEKKKQAEREKRAKQETYQRYFDLTDRYLMLKENYKKYRPSSPDDPVNPLFFDALKNLETTLYFLEQEEMKVINFVVQ